MSRSNGNRSPIASLDHIAELAQTLAPLLGDAADAGARKSGGIEFVGRGRGFTDADPTGTAALDPTRRQLRAAVRRASTLILRAEAELQAAGSVIANGYLRLDREEWVRVVEKRGAAGSVAPRRVGKYHLDGIWAHLGADGSRRRLRGSPMGEQYQRPSQQGCNHNDHQSKPVVGLGEREQRASGEDAILYATRVDGDARDSEGTDDAQDGH